jgi:dTDP-4-dehydrorhamnose reductase
MTPAAPLRIAVTGVTGQVGRALLERQEADLAFIALDRAKFDLGDKEVMVRGLDAVRPDIIVNCAAYTAVDRAESERDLAFKVNADAPACMARWCDRNGGILFHLSTDYVFSGDAGRPWRENDPISPLNVYGQSKAAGEEAVRSMTSRHLILRTSWVYAAWGHNFMRTMLRLADTRDEIKVVDDQWGKPTSAGDIADAIVRIVRRNRSGQSLFGTFHFANGDETTWYRFAHAILDRAGGLILKRPRIKPIASSEYPTPARRPLNSVLDTGLYERSFCNTPRPWREALGEVINLLRDQGRGA